MYVYMCLSDTGVNLSEDTYIYRYMPFRYGCWFFRYVSYTNTDPFQTGVGFSEEALGVTV